MRNYSQEVIDLLTEYGIGRDDFSVEEILEEELNNIDIDSSLEYFIEDLLFVLTNGYSSGFLKILRPDIFKEKVCQDTDWYEAQEWMNDLLSINYDIMTKKMCLSVFLNKENTSKFQSFLRKTDVNVLFFGKDSGYKNQVEQVEERTYFLAKSKLYKMKEQLNKTEQIKNFSERLFEILTQAFLDKKNGG